MNYHHNRYIVAGYSPRLTETPEDIYATGRVIGVNQTFRVINRYLDAWLLWDHHKSTTHVEIEGHSVIQCPKFIRNDPNNQEYFKGQRGILWFQSAGKQTIATCWETPLRLGLWGSSITAACNLAFLLGASEIVLVGVDFIGNERVGGWKYAESDPFASACQEANRFFHQFPIPVYKTVNESLLSLPFKDLGVKWTL
jgi:hypothetical protein